MASTTERGYGWRHQQERARWAPHVARGEVECWRCGKRIMPGQPWDLGHDDHDRTIYRGPECRSCNRNTIAIARGDTPPRTRHSERW